MPPPNQRFPGKYRGRVVDNNDPLRVARITAQVPDVLGDEVSTWAMPCLPFTGPQAGQYVVPEPGAGVWIEFEQGDPSYPIWSGCWYGDESELPPDARTAQQSTPPSHPVVIQTPGGHKIVLSDATGISLQTPGGAFVRIDHEGVHMGDGNGGSIRLSDGQADINEGRLIVPRKQ